MPIIKSEGVTRTERLLAQLCDRSFLRLWSYPNPFRKIAPSFVTFSRCSRIMSSFFLIAKIFSSGIWTPTRKWPGTDGSARQIDAQLRTADGAAKYIRSGRPIFLDASCTVGFPIPFDPASARIHKSLWRTVLRMRARQHPTKTCMAALPSLTEMASP